MDLESRYPNWSAYCPEIVPYRAYYPEIIKLLLSTWEFLAHISLWNIFGESKDILQWWKEFGGVNGKTLQTFFAEHEVYDRNLSVIIKESYLLLSDCNYDQEEVWKSFIEK